jgi:single-strand DNA-binding protein
MISYEYRGGRVAGQPELKSTQNGTPYLRFRLANDDSSYNDQTQQWDKKAEHFITVLVWPVKRKGDMVNLPGMLAESLNSGNSVQVWGKFATRSWETDDGSRRSVEEFTARAVAVDVLDVLPWQTLEDGQQAGGQAAGGQQAAWNTSGGTGGAPGGSGAAGGQQQGATWGTPAQPGGGVPY